VLLPRNMLIRYVVTTDCRKSRHCGGPPQQNSHTSLWK